MLYATFDMSVDSDLSSFEPSNSSSGSMIAPLLVGFAALLLGGAALYFSLGGTGKASEAQTNLEAITVKAEGLETRLRDLEAKYSEQASKLSSTEQQLKLLAGDANEAFKKASSEININRDMIETSADKLTELIDTLNRSGRPSASGGSSIPRGNPTSALPVATIEPSASPPPVASAPVVVGGASAATHTIRSGDTFTKLSEQYNVSVAAILAANPDVDPRRLPVGQKIKIPSK
ncbi:LysM peptidoglycan-binding domain-containing protein [Cerasicoccus arenae]|nr:LysM domain-containing protein [Cerasicoccus arenae]MBK1857831.1 LysM peptidoglycan-binding domain-containing protein [Cerasicoccus arenae]